MRRGQFAAIAVVAVVLAGIVHVVSTATRPAGESHSAAIRASRDLTIGTPAELARSRRQGYAERTYWAHAHAGGSFSVLNEAQGLQAQISARGVSITANHRLTLELGAPSVGRTGGVTVTAPLHTSRVDRNRVVLRSSELSEWIANGPLAIEQGFTLSHRPAGSGPLVIAQRAVGNVAGSVGAAGRAVTFSARAGSLSYTDLAVTDARGRTVPAHLGFAAGRLTITIDDLRAVYPLRVDPGIVAPTATVSTPAAATIGLGASDSDTLTVTGTAIDGPPTGQVTFYVCGPGVSSCDSTANQVGSPVTLSSGIGDSSSSTSASFAPGGTGTYCFYAVYSGDSNYASSDDDSSDGCFSVEPTLSVYVAGSQTYGATTQTFEPVDYTGFVNGDGPGVVGGTLTGCASSSEGASTDVGTYFSTISGCGGLGASGYVIAYIDDGFTVDPAPLVITASSGSMTYGGSVPVISAGYGGFVNSQSASNLTTAPTCSTAASSSSGAGTYLSSCAGAVDPNYAISYVNGSVTVNPAPLVITAPGGSMTYGGSAPTITLAPGNYNGFVNGDSAASLTLQPICSSTATSTSTAGSAQTSNCTNAYDPNYTISYVGGTVTVSKAPLAVTASSPTITYGASTPSVTPIYSGFVNNDNASALTSAPTCQIDQSSPYQAGGSYTTSCSGGTATNYTLSDTSGTLTVNPAPLTITASDGSMTYGGTGPTINPSYNGFQNGDTPSTLANTPNTAPTCSTGASSSSGAGTYTSSCTGASDPNYTITYVNGNVTVNPAPLTITASSGSFVYGGSAPTITASYSGFVNGDSAANLTPQPTCSTSASGTSAAGTYTSSCNGASDPNYAISYVNGSVTVDQAPLVITASSGSMTYGGSVPVISAGYGGFVNSQSASNLTTAPTCSTAASSSSGAGTYLSSCAGAVDPNYAISYLNGSVTVTPAPLVITASDGSMTYGGSAPTITPSYSSFVNGDSAASLTLQPICSTTATSTSAAGSAQSSSCTNAYDPNYTISYLSGTVSVNKAPLSVLVSGTQVYGASAPGGFSIAGYNGLRNGDVGSSVVTGTLTGCATSLDPSSSPAAVGTYTGTISGCSGLAATNYSVSYADDGFTVNPAPLTVTATGPTSSTYGSIPTISPSYSGWVGSDSPASLTTPATCFTTDTPTTTVGSVPTTACTGASDPNYTISYINGSLTVEKAPLAVSASSPTITYGANTPSVTPTYSGFQNGENASALTTAPTCQIDQSSPYQAGGSYTTSCSGGSATNYTLNYTSGTLTVNPAPLTITASSTTITYGGTAPTITPSYSGFVDSQSASNLTTTPTCSTVVSSSSPAATYPSSCSGAVDPNYTISYVAGSVTVNPAPLVITAPNETMTYGGTVPTVTLSSTDYSGFENGDTAASLTSQATCFTTANSSSPVGSAPVTACEGATDPNYAISYVNGSVTVGKASLTVTASSPTITYGASTPTVTPIYSGFVNNDNASDLTSAPACIIAPGPYDVGNYTTSCSGAGDPNYTISYAAGSLTINPAPLTITAPSPTITYGQTVPTITPQYAGFVGGDSSANLTTPATCVSGAGTPTPVAGSYTTSCSGAGDPNYVITYASGTFTVKPATLTITAQPVNSITLQPVSSMTYGAAAPSVNPSYSGFEDGDSSSSLTTQPTCFTTASPTSNANTTLPAICTGAADPNYTILYEPGKVTVEPAPLTITASSATILYGDTVPAITPTYTGFVNNDDIGDLTTPASCMTSATSTSPASATPYVTECSSASDSNYDISYVNGTLTVNQAPLAITVTGTQVYGGSPSFTVAGYNAFVNDETALEDFGAQQLSGCTTTVPATEPAGVYSGTIHNCGGLTDSNYAISYIDGGFTVTDAHTASVSALPLPSIAIGQSEVDSVVVTGNVVGGAPTGQVAFYECGVESGSVVPCTTGGTQVGSDVTLITTGADTARASSAAFAPDSGPGTYCFRAQYLHDNNYYASADGTTDECFTVTQTNASVSASPSSSSAGLGSPVTDTATITGNAVAGSPTGTVTFYACTPGTTPCSSGGAEFATADLVGGANDTATATSNPYLAAHGEGTYCFRVVYSGDANYVGGTDGSSDQCISVGKGASSTVSAISYGTIQSGDSDNDNATVTGNTANGAPTGTVSFYVCGPGAASCASTASQLGSPITLTVGSGDSSSAASPYFTPTTSGSYCLYAVYSGDGNYAGSADATSDGCFTLAAAAAPSAPSTASTAAPSNAFAIDAHAFKHDAISVTLALPDAGSLQLLAARNGTTLATSELAVSAAGNLTAKLTLNSQASAALANAIKRHKAFKATVTITFTPTGGSPHTETLTLTLATASKKS